MTVRQCLSTGLIAALMTGMVPATTWAAGPTEAQKTTTANLHLAIARAAVESAHDASLQMLPTRPTATDPNVRKQSSGGGHAMMVMTIIGSLVGVAATVYMVKELQKTEKQATTQNQ